MAEACAHQILKYTKGMRLVGVANRHIEKAQNIFSNRRINAIAVSSQTDFDKTIANNGVAVTKDPYLLCKNPEIEVFVEITGTVEYALPIVLEAIKNKKHIVSVNSELDGTFGPLLKIQADKAGVIYTNSDGDQPGVQMNLYRFVKGMGITPVLIGNIKGLQDPYRTPKTQASYAAKWHQNPHMVTSYADGTKISFEQAIVANACGFHVAKRGMLAPFVPPGTPLEIAVKKYDADTLLKNPGIVDYIVGADPNPGVFILGSVADDFQRQFLKLYKLGDGPLYLYYTPYHLCHFEVPNTIARVALFADCVLTPKDKPYVEVISIAKRDLDAGEVIDGIGYYMVYGECENSSIARNQDLLPIGLAQGCKLKKAIKKDAAITFGDVELPQGRFIDKMWREQCGLFFPEY